MSTDIFKTIEEIQSKIQAADVSTEANLEAFRIKFLGKKGILNDFFISFKEIINVKPKTLIARNDKIKKHNGKNY